MVSKACENNQGDGSWGVNFVRSFFLPFIFFPTCRVCRLEGVIFQKQSNKKALLIQDLAACVCTLNSRADLYKHQCYTFGLFYFILQLTSNLNSNREILSFFTWKCLQSVHPKTFTLFYAQTIFCFNITRTALGMGIQEDKDSWQEATAMRNHLTKFYI